MKATGSDVLFFADTPEFVSIDTSQVIRTAVGGIRIGEGIARGLRYRGYSFLEDREPHPNPALMELSAADRVAYLKIPPNTDPRIRELARTIAVGVNDFERSRTLERYLRTNFGYTTELLSGEVPDPVAHFLFQRRKGHCEYFASAMALMLRTAGIPSRVATGFQSGVFNPLSGWYLIRASDAHSWVEAWLPSQGWVTFDPTPPDPTGGAGSLWARAQLYFDAVEVFWQEWVMAYDLERQLLLADRMGRYGRGFNADWRRSIESWGSILSGWKSGIRLPLVVALAGTLVWIALVLCLGPRVWAWWKTRQRLRALHTSHGNANDATILYRRMLRTLHKQGIEKPAWLTPGEFATVVPGPQSRNIVQELTREYNELRFGGRGESAPRIVSLLEKLERNAGQ
jgi:transglutaminase-like putative cysteine protease